MLVAPRRGFAPGNPAESPPSNFQIDPRPNSQFPTRCTRFLKTFLKLAVPSAMASVVK